MRSRGTPAPRSLLRNQPGSLTGRCLRASAGCSAPAWGWHRGTALPSNHVHSPTTFPNAGCFTPWENDHRFRGDVQVSPLCADPPLGGLPPVRLSRTPTRTVPRWSMGALRFRRHPIPSLPSVAHGVRLWSRPWPGSLARVHRRQAKPDGRTTTKEQGHDQRTTDPHDQRKPRFPRTPGSPDSRFSTANLRISVMVISRFGERDQFGRWCCAVNRL